MSEDKEMQQDKQVRVRWFMFDVPTLALIIGTIVSGVSAYYSLQGRIDQLEVSRDDRANVTDSKFVAIERKQDEAAAQLQPLNTVVHRVTALEGQLLATNQRLDRFIDLLSSNIELIRKDINNLTIEVRVLAQEVKTQRGPTTNGRTSQ